MKKKYTLLTLSHLIGLSVFAQHTVTIKKGDATNFQYFTIQGDTTKNTFKATIANYENRFEDAARFTVKAIDEGEFKSEDIQNGYYDAACYLTLVNKNREAIAYLIKSIEHGWSDLGHLEHDPDLQPLKSSPAWQKIIVPKLLDYYASNNKELAQMFADDQNARLSGKFTDDLTQKDAQRRTRVLQLIKADALISGHDFYKAGMIMHHGTTTEDYQKAQELLEEAQRKKPMHFRAPWLLAASKDRLLLSQGKPQWYGTQGMTVINGKIALDPKLIDTSAVSPKQRKLSNAPSIETLRTYLENFKSN